MSKISSCVESVNRCLQPFYNFRYNFVRMMCCITSTIPYHIPLIGGRSAFELIIIGGIMAAFLASCTNFASAGQMASYAGGLLILLGLRHNILNYLFGISFERALFYHKCAAIVLVVAIALHIIFCDERSNSSGIILTSLIGAACCSYFIKQFHFETFYFIHIALLIPILVIGRMHGAAFFSNLVIAWIIDMIWRYIISLNVVDAEIEYLNGDIVRVVVEKPFHYEALQYCFILIPEISYFEFHVS